MDDGESQALGLPSESNDLSVFGELGDLNRHIFVAHAEELESGVQRFFRLGMLVHLCEIEPSGGDMGRRRALCQARDEGSRGQERG